MRHVLRHLTIAGLLFLASGALLRTTGDSGDAHAVNAALKRHVQAGVTDVDQVIEKFGEPISRQSRRGPGDSEVLGYSHKAFASSLFPLFPSLSFLHHDPADTFLEVSDGVVTRYWTEL